MIEFAALLAGMSAYVIAVALVLRLFRHGPGEGE